MLIGGAAGVRLHCSLATCAGTICILSSVTGNGNDGGMSETDQSRIDSRLMELALEEAANAAAEGEIPIGAVLALNGEPIGRGRNGSIRLHDPAGHAEILALRDAARRLQNYRLPGTVLYCSVEPCLMCLGAVLHARVSRLVYGASDPKIGATALLESIRKEEDRFNHRFEVKGGVLAERSGTLLVNFFKDRRGK
jgi:tRNA(adenine34) deaminase